MFELIGEDSAVCKFYKLSLKHEHYEMNLIKIGHYGVSVDVKCG